MVNIQITFPVLTTRQTEFGIATALVLTTYTLVVIGLRKAFGPEAEGAGAIGLTALATTFLPQYRRRVNSRSRRPNGIRFEHQLVFGFAPGLRICRNASLRRAFL
jgi:hypothetical protein